jgi:hypothetical protein
VKQEEALSTPVSLDLFDAMRMTDGSFVLIGVARAEELIG